MMGKRCGPRYGCTEARGFHLKLSLHKMGVNEFMKLRDFYQSATQLVVDSSNRHSISLIARAAQKQYDQCCHKPLGVIVKFTWDTSHKKQLRLLVRLTAPHPYYRGWLKASALRITDSISEVEFTAGASPIFHPIAPFDTDSDIEDVVKQLELRVVERVEHLDEELRTLRKIVAAHALAPECLLTFLSAINEMEYSSVYNFKHPNDNKLFWDLLNGE